MSQRGCTISKFKASKFLKKRNSSSQAAPVYPKFYVNEVKLFSKDNSVDAFFRERWNSTLNKSVKNRYGILESLSASKKRKCSNIAITENIFTLANLKILKYKE